MNLAEGLPNQSLGRFIGGLREPDGERPVLAFGVEGIVGPAASASDAAMGFPSTDGKGGVGAGRTGIASASSPGPRGGAPGRLSRRENELAGMPAMAGSTLLTSLPVSSRLTGAAVTVASAGRVAVASPFVPEGRVRTGSTLVGGMMWIVRRMRAMAVNMVEPRRGGGSIVPVRSYSSKSHSIGVAIGPITSHGCHPMGCQDLKV